MSSVQSQQSRKQVVQHYAKQVNMQIKDSQIEPFVLDYQAQVIQPNTQCLLIYSMLAFVVFVFVDAFIYNIQGNVTTESQTIYLTHLQTLFEQRLNQDISNVQIFLNLYKQSFPFLFNESEYNPFGCNSTSLNCTSIMQEFLSNMVEISYNMTQKNYYNFISPISEVQDSQFFLYVPAYHLFVPYMFSPNLQFSAAEKLVFYIQEQTKVGTYYVLPFKKVITKQLYYIKLLICTVLNDMYLSPRACVITPGNIQENLKIRQNKLKFLKSNMVVVSSNQTTKNLGNEQEQMNELLVQTINGNVENENFEFYFSFKYQDCLQKYNNNEYITQNVIKTCNPPQLVYFLAPLTIFLSHKRQIVQHLQILYTQKIDTHNQQSELSYMMLSNKTFIQNQSKSIRVFNQRQSYVCFCLAFFTALWVLLMPIFPLRLVGVDLATSISLLIKLCKTVKQIKNKDDIQQQIDIFNKLYIEINKGNHIFYQTIQYFKYFIWYRKWIYITKFSKKKLLLQQGLSLFGSSDFAPVLVYIYKKQIERQTKIACNYKKMRKIFTQRFIIVQNQEKIETSLNIGKGRTGNNNAKKVKKSGFNKQFSNLENDIMYGRDFCMFENVENRINKQLQFLQIQKKSKRYVRFSNDLHQQDKPPYYRASKFLVNISSQLFNKNSQKSLDQQKKKQQVLKRQDQQIGSNPVQSSRQERIVQLREQDSQMSQKNDQDWNYYLKFDQQSQQNSIQDQEDLRLQLKKYSLKKLDDKLGQVYQSIFRSYQKMILIKKMYIDKQEVVQKQQYINELYQMLIQKLRYTYKFIKHKNKQREKMLKQLNRKMINLKKQKRMINQIDFNRKQKLANSQKWLQQTISVIEDEILEETKLIDVDYKQFSELQQRYKINLYLMQRAKLYQVKVLKSLSYPIPYKKLESLCQSLNDSIRIQAKILMAAQFFHISPHADLQILSRAQQNLIQTHTTYSQKQKTLKLIKKVLRNRQILQEEQKQIQLIKNYYNYAHRKFYFIVDLSDNYEVFRPTLSQIYKNMGEVDMFQILNLAMSQTIQDMIMSGNQIKSTKLGCFQSKFQNIHNEANKIKSVASTKTGNKKMAYEKDFNKILSKIQQQNINLSKFLVIILGGQNQSQSKTHQDHQSSSAHNRQIYQQIHQQILNKLQINFFHIILIGFNLKDYQTRQGKLKKYAKHTYDLLEIDLSKSSIQKHTKQLSNFINK